MITNSQMTTFSIHPTSCELLVSTPTCSKSVASSPQEKFFKTKVYKVNHAQELPKDVVDMLENISTLKVCGCPRLTTLSLRTLLPNIKQVGLINLRQMLYHVDQLHRIRCVVSSWSIPQLVAKYLSTIGKGHVAVRELENMQITGLMITVFPVLAHSLLKQADATVTQDFDLSIIPAYWSILEQNWIAFMQLVKRKGLDRDTSIYYGGFRNIRRGERPFHHLKDMDPMYELNPDGTDPENRRMIGYVNWLVMERLGFCNRMTDCYLTPLINTDVKSSRKTKDAKQLPTIEISAHFSADGSWMLREGPASPHSDSGLLGGVSTSTACQICSTAAIPRVQYSAVPKDLLALYTNCYQDLNCPCRHVHLCTWCVNRADAFVKHLELEIAKADYELPSDEKAFQRRLKKMIKTQLLAEPNPYDNKICRKDVEFFLSPSYHGERSDFSLLCSSSIDNTTPPRRDRRPSAEKSPGASIFAQAIESVKSQSSGATLPRVSPRRSSSSSLESSTFTGSRLSISEQSNLELPSYSSRAFFNHYVHRPLGITQVEDFWRQAFAKKFFLEDPTKSQGCFRPHLDMNHCIENYHAKLLALMDHKDPLFT